MSFNDIVNALGFAVCHQLPERCPQLGGHLFPFCARCLGTYLGAFLGYLSILLTRRWRANDLPQPRYAVVLLCFLALIFLDVLTLWLKLRPESAPLRTLTGLTAGGALTMLAYPLLGDELIPKRPSLAVMERWWQLATLCGLLAMGLSAIYLGPGWLYYPLVICASLGVIFIFYNTVYVVLLLIVSPKSRRLKVILAVCSLVLMLSLLAFLYWLHGRAVELITGTGVT
jgi:uncharacterized membrane protein